MMMFCPGSYLVDVMNVRIESFENIDKFTKVLGGKLPLLSKYFIHPVVILDHVGITKDIPAMIVLDQITFVQTRRCWQVSR